MKETKELYKLQMAASGRLEVDNPQKSKINPPGNVLGHRSSPGANGHMVSAFDARLCTRRG